MNPSLLGAYATRLILPRIKNLKIRKKFDNDINFRPTVLIKLNSLDQVLKLIKILKFNISLREVIN